MTLGPGSRLGRYELLAPIGAGGMGQVFRARDARLDRLVAVKVLAHELALDAEMRQRFERETRAVAALSHPNILAIHDVGDEQGILYAVMELLEGETLKQRLRKGTLPVTAVHQIALQIAGGLAAAHGRGVVHRDLKPENVFLEARGTVKILDFGLARMHQADRSTDDDTRGRHQTRPGIILGTTLYMSPEQARGVATDHRTDIFSFGVVLHEMLWGTLPFTGATTADIVSAILREDVPARTHADGMGASLDAILRRCLQKHPEDRFQTSSDLVLALEGAQPDAITGHVSVEPIAPALPDPRRSVAVLPLVDMSPAHDLEYLCDGIAEEIISALMKVPGLRVAARTSAFRFKGAAEDIRAVGHALNAGAVLEGSVRMAGNRLRIITQLINVEDGYQLWSERFDRTLDDVFAVQDEVARAVADALRLTLTSGMSRNLLAGRPEDPEAYTLYLKGRHFWSKRTEEGLRKSLTCFQSAIDRDPLFGRAHAGLAESYVTLGLYGVVDPNEVMPRARAEAQSAIDIFGPSASAYATLGCVQGMYDWAWDEAEGSFRKAIDAGPDAPSAHHWYAINHLVPRGRFEEAEAELRYALAADPLSPPISATFGLRSYFAHRYEAAIEELSGTLAFEGTFATAHLFLGLTLAEMGRFDAALEQIDRAIQLTQGSPEMRAARGYVAARAGMTTRAQDVLDALEAAAAERYVSPSLFAQVYSGLGDRPAALDWLEKARDIRAADLAWIAVRPVFDQLHDEPRFQAIRRSMHLEHVAVR
jgi:eukaryotic-like serine/threonine-protein kinase